MDEGDGWVRNEGTGGGKRRMSGCVLIKEEGE